MVIRTRWNPLLTALVAAAMVAPFTQATAAEPLHVRIDRAIAEAHIGPVAPPADDAEFLRRIYLDLAGVIPSSVEARVFAFPPKRFETTL